MNYGSMQTSQEACQRCGSCCTSGGPALHSEDRTLVVDGHISREHLITIRKGELVRHPLKKGLHPVTRELIKISGIGTNWNCLYFDPHEQACTIYDSRPQACRALECWNTAAVEDLIEKDTLTRLDLIDDADPLHRLVQEHEQRFPCPDMLRLLTSGPEGRERSLEQTANEEARFRMSLAGRFDLSLGAELFHFGRPLFHLFVSVGAEVVEVDRRLIVTWPDGGAD